MSDREDKLLAAAVSGDEDALVALLEEHGVAVRGGLEISSKWTGMIDPDDVMQVTYLEAFLHIQKFKPHGPSSFRQWIRRIAENNLLDAIRELERDQRKVPRKPPAADSDSYAALLDELSGTTTTPSHGAGRREVQRIVENAIQKLPHEYAKVIRLHELEGKPGPEVATLLGRSHGAIRMLLCRAKDRLREILGTESAYFSDTA